MRIIVSSKGRITLPAEARRRLGIRAGTRLEFIVRADDRLEVIKISGSVRDLKGVLVKPRQRRSLQEMDKAAAAGARRAPRAAMIPLVKA